MKLIRPSFEIIRIADLNSESTPLEFIERCGRICYKSEEKITPESNIAFIKAILKRGHESVIEHSFMTVKFVVDRGVSHEMVRHRLASFSQESTRYCNYTNEKFDGDLTFILPPWISHGEGQYEPKWQGCVGSHDIDPYEKGSPESWWFWSCAHDELTYRNLIASGWEPQQARTVLPNSLKTEVIMSANLREWRKVLSLRADKPAHPQMKEIMVPLLKTLREAIPIMFDDVVPEAE